MGFVNNGQANAQAAFAIVKITETESQQELMGNTEYRFGEVTSLMLILPAELTDEYIASIVFTSGAEAVNLIYPENIKWSGTDCFDEVFTPVANKRYNVCIWYDGVNVCAVVGGASVELSEP